MRSKTTSLLILFVFAAGCTPHPAPTASPAPSTDTAVPIATSAAPFVTSIPTLVATSAASPMPTQQPVTVAAVKGNLYIRRGPDLGFNPIAVLTDGQKETAIARDVLAEWVQIALPGNADKTGWISIQTSYSAVTGDVSTLPEVEPSYWPTPAFVRNCTFHDMTVEPGGIQLPAVTNFPANDVRINPGIYRVYDTDVDGYPEVLKVDLREGSAIDVIVDGNGFKKKCAEP